MCFRRATRGAGIAHSASVEDEFPVLREGFLPGRNPQWRHRRLEMSEAIRDAVRAEKAYLYKADPGLAEIEEAGQMYNKGK